MTHTKVIDEIRVKPASVSLSALATMGFGVFLLLSIGFMHAPVLHNGAPGIAIPVDQIGRIDRKS